ncbi:MAG: hypothetical protein AAF430_05045 [Myxococcota bacterium]
MSVSRIRTLLCLGLFAIGLAASAAHAVVLQGRGELHAGGNGIAAFQMVGMLAVSGGGALIIDDDIRVETQGVGRVTDLGDGRLLYEGYGRAIARSTAPFTAKITGAKIRLHAKGKGRAFLKGCGRLEVGAPDEGGLDEEWGPDLELDFDSDGS